MVFKVEGTIILSENNVFVQTDNGDRIELKDGDEFEVLVFTALIRFEWITVRLRFGENGFYVQSPNSRRIELSQIKRVRV